MTVTQEPSSSVHERLERALKVVRRLQADGAGRGTRHQVAITGIGMRLPGGIVSMDDLWEALEEGRVTTGDFPDDRWPADGPGDHGADPQDLVPAHYLAQSPYAFDSTLFGINESEATSMDPQHRLALECLWDAFESAGVKPESLSGTRTGVYFGQSTNDYVRLRQQYGRPEDVGPYNMVGEAAFLAGRISHMYGLTGPSLMIDTACSSSLVALQNAAEAVASGRIDRAIVGGVNLILSPYGFRLLGQTGALAPDGLCKTFSSRADGYGRGEGCVVVIVERLEEARSRRARVWATIDGTAVNHDGHSGGLSVPSGAAQRALLRAALESAGLGPERIGYIEAHGTGTGLGDPLEMGGISEVIGTEGRREAVLVGSVKSNLGHLEAASGLAGVAKALLVLGHGTVPLTVNATPPNPGIVLEDTRVRIATDQERLPADGRVMVNSFGASGTNVSIVLGGAPREDTGETGGTQDGPALFVMSAASADALRDRAVSLRQTLRAGTAGMQAVASTLIHGRSDLSHRLAVWGTRDDVVRDLGDWLEGEPAPVSSGVVKDDLAPGIAFAFSGQGQQYPGMGRDAALAGPVAARIIDEATTASPALEPYLSGAVDGAAPEIVQPAMVAVEVALAAELRAAGCIPTVAVGHSLGEISAAVDVGMLTLGDGLRLARARGMAMGGFAGRGTLLAVSLPWDEVDAIVRGMDLEVTCAAFNSRVDCTAVGSVQDITALEEVLRERKTRFKRLPTDIPFHSPALRSIATELVPVLDTVRFSEPSVPLISTLTGESVTADLVSGVDYWADQASRPVVFGHAVASAVDRGVDAFIEVGPGHALASLGWRRSLPGQWTTSLEQQSRPGDLAGRVAAELYVSGNRGPATGLVQPGPVVDLPTYPFEHGSDFRFSPRAMEPDQPYRPHGYVTEWVPAPAQMDSPADGPLTVVTLGDGDSAFVAALRRLRPDLGVTTLRVADLAGADTSNTGPVIVDMTQYPDASRQDAAEDLTGSLVAVAQALDGAGPLWVLTRRAIPMTDRETVPGIASSPAWGICLVGVLERPEAWGGAIDIDAPTPQAIQRVLDTVLGGGDEDQVVVRHGQPFVPRLQHARDTGRQPVSVSAQGAYLVTGGTGGLGLVLVEWLAARGASHLVLLARRGETELGEETRRRLDLVRGRGVTIDVVAVDVADTDQVLGELGRVVPDHERVHGVFHAAGASSPRTVADLEPADIRHSLRAKVGGAESLRAVAERYSPEYVVLYSSIASVWGSANLGMYAASNRYLDSFAADLTDAGTPTMSISWGPWLVGSGLGDEELLEHLRASGLDAMDPAEAMERMWLHVLQPGHRVEAIVDWQRMITLMSLRRGRPAIQHLAAGSADTDGAGRGGELLARLRGLSSADRRELVGDHIRGLLAAQLRLDRAELTDDASLVELGLDSIGVLEVQGRLSRALGAELEPARFFEVPAPEWDVMVLAALEAQGVLEAAGE